MPGGHKASASIVGVHSRTASSAGVGVGLSAGAAVAVAGLAGLATGDRLACISAASLRLAEVLSDSVVALWTFARRTASSLGWAVLAAVTVGTAAAMAATGVAGTAGVAVSPVTVGWAALGKASAATVGGTALDQSIANVVTETAAAANAPSTAGLR